MVLDRFLTVMNLLISLYGDFLTISAGQNTVEIYDHANKATCCCCRPVARIFCGGGGGGERGQSGPNYRNTLLVIDCLVSRLFQGDFRVTPTRKTRQGHQQSTPSS